MMNKRLPGLVFEFSVTLISEGYGMNPLMTALAMMHTEGS